MNPGLTTSARAALDGRGARSITFLRGAVLSATLVLATTFPSEQIPAARAAVENGGLPGAWLSNYAGARSLGLGGAFVAAGDDALAALWNPASLSHLDQNQLLFENSQLFESTSMNAFGFAVPGRWLPSFGVSVVTLRSGEFQKTNELNDDLGTFSQSEMAYYFSLAKHFGTRFAVGANLKVVQQSVEEANGGGVGFDLGGILNLTPDVAVGASLLNLGGPSVQLRTVAESYPTELRGGVAVRVLGGRGLLSVQVDQLESGTRFHGGAEYWIQPSLAMRMGFDQDAGTGGVSYRLGPQYQIDYGVTDHPLGMSHRFGLSYRFGGFFASSNADPALFSPTGEHAVTKMHLNARTKSDAESWTLDIVSKSDETVRRFGGKGLPPAHLLWDGKDETGLPLPDGVYRYQLVVKDLEGRIVAGPVREVEISTGGPQGSIPVISTP
jgi:hypothetical protein